MQTFAEKVEEFKAGLTAAGLLVASPAFDTWLDAFVTEKGIDPEETFDVEGDSGTNTIPYGVIFEHMKIAPPNEQKAIKDKMVMLDFKNADIKDFLRHLGKAIAASFDPKKPGGPSNYGPREDPTRNRFTPEELDRIEYLEGLPEGEAEGTRNGRPYRHLSKEEQEGGPQLKAAKEDLLSVGDTVLHRGSYGQDAEAPAVIEAITLADEKGGSEGVAVKHMNWDLVPEWAVVDLANAGGWAYGHQIKPMPADYKVAAAAKPSRAALEQAAKAVLSPDEQALYRQMSLVSGLQKFGADASPEMVQKMKAEGLVDVEVYQGIPMDPYLTPRGQEAFNSMWARVLQKAGIQAGLAKPMAWMRRGKRAGIAQDRDPGCWPQERLFDQPDLYHKNLNTIQDTPPQSGVSTIG